MKCHRWEPAAKSDAAHEKDQHQRVDDEDRPGVIDLTEVKVDHTVENRAAEGDRNDNVAQLEDACIAPQAFEQPKRHERSGADYSEPEKHVEEMGDFLCRN